MVSVIEYHLHTFREIAMGWEWNYDYICLITSSKEVEERLRLMVSFGLVIVL